MSEFVTSTVTVTQAGAAAAIDAALAAAGDLGVRINVAVTDRGGDLIAFARMDGAFAESSLIAIDKAWTVCRFAGIPSDALYAALADEPDSLAGISGRPRVSAFPGGLPALIDGALAGAVGVSGATAAQDKIVAVAAVTAIAGGESP